MFGAAVKDLDLVVCDLPDGQAECTARNIQWCALPPDKAFIDVPATYFLKVGPSGGGG